MFNLLDAHLDLYLKWLLNFIDISTIDITKINKNEKVILSQLSDSRLGLNKNINLTRISLYVQPKSKWNAWGLIMGIWNYNLLEK